jgi:Kef-type K+ transport system membrane component KefB
MEAMGFLGSLGIIAVCAAVMVALGRAVRMPAIVAYLLCGILLGPILGWVKMEDGLELVSETGIALLLFLVGLELSISKVRDVGKVALVGGFLQVVVTAALGFGLSMVLGFGMVETMFLAMAVTFSSTVVAVKLLEEKGELESLYGRIALGVLLVQDLVVIVLLTFLAGMSGGGGALDAGAVGMGLLKAFGGMAALLTIALVAAKYLLPRPFKWAARSPEILLIWALSWCFLMVFGAHEFGLSLEVGAFLAGMSLAQLPYNENLRMRVHPLMNFFIAVFFVMLGVRIDFGGAMDHVGATLSLSALVLIIKPLVFLGIIGAMGYGRKTAFLTGVTLAQTSEFSFILAGLAMAKGLIGGEVMLVTALVGVGTIAVSSYMINQSHGLYAWVLKTGFLRFRFLDGKPEVTDRIVHAGEGLARHVIVVGMNTLGRDLVRRLVERGEDVLAVDTDPVKLEGLPGKSLLGSVGYLSVLEEAGFEKAKLLVSALQIEETNDLLAYRCKSVGVPCAIHVVDLSLVDNLLELEAEYLMVSKVDGVKAQLRTLKEMGVLK